MEKYFAIDCRLDDLFDKIDLYYKTLDDVGHTRKIQTSYFYYYGKGEKASYLHASGSQGQNTEIVINDYASLIKHVTTLVTGNRPSFDARSTNTDYESQAQTILGEQILEYYMREKGVEKILKKACSYGVKYSEGFIGMDWDVKMGNIIAADEEGNPVNEGDIRYSIYHPLQIVRDCYNDGDQDWIIVVQNINKYNLAAKYPEYAEHILDIVPDQGKASERNIDYLLDNRTSMETDMIPFYIFYHKKCAVLPEGKIAFFVEGKKLQEGTLPYENIPVFRVAPDNFDGYCLGYTGMWDLLGIQEASDQLYSAVTSNNLSFAKQVIQTTRDNDINVSDLADGLMLIESEAELKPVQLTRSAPESYQLLQVYQSKMQELSGVNEVIRGVPSPNLRSGNSMALVAAQAITYNSGIEGAYNVLIEDVGTETLRFLKSFATSPRFAAIVGKYKKAFMQTFTGDDLANIDRVTVDLQGSVAKTTAGKVQLAENLLQNGLITRPEQYIMVMETGKLDPLVEPSEVELLNIRHENEMLAQGEAPAAIALDNHPLHINEHKSVVANPEARNNPTVVQTTLAHIMEHINLLKTTPPELLQVLGIQALPPTEMAPPQGGSAEVLQPPESPMPPNVPSPPNLPPEADATTQQSYEQLQSMQQ